MKKCWIEKKLLDGKFANKKVEIIGPSEPFLAKINNKYQRKLIVKYKNRDDVNNVFKELIDAINNMKKIQISINIDPESDY